MYPDCERWLETSLHCQRTKYLPKAGENPVVSMKMYVICGEMRRIEQTLQKLQSKWPMKLSAQITSNLVLTRSAIPKFVR